MAPRSTLALRLSELVGSEALVVTEPASGWPALARINIDGEWSDVDLFLGPVGLSHRKRDKVERRFQNPGPDHPIILTPGRRPLLVGVWDGDSLAPAPRTVIVLADPLTRVGRRTRQSIFQSLTALQEAAKSGWAVHRSESGEVMHYLLPALLPLAAAARDDLSLGPEQIVPDEVVQAVVLGAGLAEADGLDLGAASRARRASWAIIRDARFSRRVLDAYSGLCAMCGLDAGLVQAAHIYPAAAPGSPDEPWNGLALCPTHHVAFDHHLIAVRPDDGRVEISDLLASQRATSPAVQGLMSSTFNHLVVPNDSGLAPRKDMFLHRYSYFEHLYDWLPFV